jgi:hypothetical protein
MGVVSFSWDREVEIELVASVHSEPLFKSFTCKDYLCPSSINTINTKIYNIKHSQPSDLPPALLICAMLLQLIGITK